MTRAKMKLAQLYLVTTPSIHTRFNQNVVQFSQRQGKRDENNTRSSAKVNNYRLC